MFRENTFIFHAGDTAFELSYTACRENRQWYIEGYEICSPRTHKKLPEWMQRIIRKHVDIYMLIDTDLFT